MNLFCSCYCLKATQCCFAKHGTECSLWISHHHLCLHKLILLSVVYMCDVCNDNIKIILEVNKIQITPIDFQLKSPVLTNIEHYHVTLSTYRHQAIPNYYTGSFIFTCICVLPHHECVYHTQIIFYFNVFHMKNLVQYLMWYSPWNWTQISPIPHHRSSQIFILATNPFFQYRR